MTLYHLRYLSQRLNYATEFRRVLQIKTNKRTSLKSNLGRINLKLRAIQNAQINQFLITLMNSSTRHITLTSYLQERYTSIVRYHLEYLSVQCVQLMMSHNMYIFRYNIKKAGRNTRFFIYSVCN